LIDNTNDDDDDNDNDTLDDNNGFVTLSSSVDQVEQADAVPVIVLSARHLLLRPGSGQPVGAVYRT
jgi:hypothetical protein